MSLRVLHVIDSLQSSGAARQLLWLVQGLAGQGFDVHICVLGRGGSLLSECSAAGVAATVIGRRWPVDPLAYRRLARHITGLRPAIVHTWDHLSGLYGRLAVLPSPFGRGVGGEGSRANSPPPDSLREGEGTVLIAGVTRIDRWRGHVAWLVERRLARATDRFLVPHDGVRNWCISHGLPEERLLVVPGGVPPVPATSVSRDELLRDLRLPADARLVGVVGRLVPDKRVKDLIWAADLLRVLRDNLRLLVIGDGPERRQLERFARLASDLEHIHFLGERRDLWRIMPHLDALWNGSETAGYATSILEAMVAGVPVLASDVPGHRDLVVDGATGFLVPIDGRAALARATDRLLADADLAARLGAAARQRVLNYFSAEQFVQRHANLYQGLAG